MQKVAKTITPQTLEPLDYWILSANLGGATKKNTWILGPMNSWTLSNSKVGGKRKRTFTVTNSGFTLLEILISVSILAIALTIVFKAQSQSIVMAEETKFNATAPFLAQLRLAEAEHNIEEGPDENSGDFGEDMPGYRWQTSVNLVESQVLAEDADPLKRIDVVVSLHGGAFEYKLRKYVIGKQD